MLCGKFLPNTVHDQSVFPQPIGSSVNASKWDAGFLSSRQNAAAESTHLFQSATAGDLPENPSARDRLENPSEAGRAGSEPRFLEMKREASLLPPG